MRYSLTLLFGLMVFLDVRAQTPHTAALADSLLRPGNFKAALVSYEFPPEIARLQQKALQHLEGDPQWARKYVTSQVRRGVTVPDIPYLDASGLTRQEFEQMLDGFRKKRQAVLKDTFAISIIKVKGVICFKGSGKLAVYNYLTIDPGKGVIVYDNYKLEGEIKLDGKIYAPVLHGYEAAGSEEIPGTTHTANGFSGFSVGKNEHDDRTTMILILQPIRNGRATFEPIPITILN